MDFALQLNRDELKLLIKEAVREVIQESGWENYLKTMPYVADREMADIKTFHGKPELEAYYSEELG